MSRDFSRYDFEKFNPDNKYHLYVDADTIVYASAASCSRDECRVTYKPTNKHLVFSDFNAFSLYLEVDEKGKKTYLSDYDVPVIGFAIGNMKRKIEEVLDHQWIDDYTLYIGGKNNFRYEVFPEYKGNRSGKPKLLEHCQRYLKSKYAGKVVICDGAEAEDFVIADSRDIEKSVVGYVDKDLENHEGYFLNYQNLDLGVFYIDKQQAFYNLCVQLLTGDSTDNIFGINFVSQQLKDVFKVKTKSIGKATAKKLLADVSHDKVLLKERVCRVYELSYGEDWRDELIKTGKLIFIFKEHNTPFSLDLFLRGVSSVSSK